MFVAVWCAHRREQASLSVAVIFLSYVVHQRCYPFMCIRDVAMSTAFAITNAEASDGPVAPGPRGGAFGSGSGSGNASGAVSAVAGFSATGAATAMSRRVRSGMKGSKSPKVEADPSGAVTALNPLALAKAAASAGPVAGAGASPRQSSSSQKVEADPSGTFTVTNPFALAKRAAASAAASGPAPEPTPTASAASVVSGAPSAAVVALRRGILGLAAAARKQDAEAAAAAVTATTTAVATPVALLSPPTSTSSTSSSSRRRSSGDPAVITAAVVDVSLAPAHGRRTSIVMEHGSSGVEHPDVSEREVVFVPPPSPSPPTLDAGSGSSVIGLPRQSSTRDRSAAIRRALLHSALKSSPSPVSPQLAASDAAPAGVTDSIAGAASTAAPPAALSMTTSLPPPSVADSAGKASPRTLVLRGRSRPPPPPPPADDTAVTFMTSPVDGDGSASRDVKDERDGGVDVPPPVLSAARVAAIKRALSNFSPAQAGQASPASGGSSATPQGASAGAPPSVRSGGKTDVVAPGCGTAADADDADRNARAAAALARAFAGGRKRVAAASGGDAGGANTTASAGSGSGSGSSGSGSGLKGGGFLAVVLAAAAAQGPSLADESKKPAWARQSSVKNALRATASIAMWSVDYNSFEAAFLISAVRFGGVTRCTVSRLTLLGSGTAA